MHKMSIKRDRVLYLHQATWIPVPPTWIQEIDAEFYAMWPVLTASLVRKHLPKIIYIKNRWYTNIIYKGFYCGFQKLRNSWRMKYSMFSIVNQKIRSMIIFHLCCIYVFLYFLDWFEIGYDSPTFLLTHNNGTEGGVIPSNIGKSEKYIIQRTKLSTK